MGGQRGSMVRLIVPLDFTDFSPQRAFLSWRPGWEGGQNFYFPFATNILALISLWNVYRDAVGYLNKRITPNLYQNDGYSLCAVEDDSVDLVFSFNSLVHVGLDVFEHYVPQIVRKLRHGGFAFIHHSNLGAFGNAFGSPHSRDGSVSRENVERLIAKNGGKVVIQEVINWVNNVLPQDCLTLFAKDADGKVDPVHLYNLRFAEEAVVVREFQAFYSQVGSRGA